MEEHRMIDVLRKMYEAEMAHAEDKLEVLNKHYDRTAIN